MNPVEKLIARYTIERLVNDGYELAVVDEEGDEPLERSTAIDKTLDMLGECDTEWLYVFKIGAKERLGWVRFIYGNGNSGFDVVSDYTTNLEPVMGRVTSYVDGMEAATKLIKDALSCVVID